MKNNKIKLISIVLAVMIAISCVLVTGVTANAATSASGDVVYFDNSVTNWSKVNCYMWTDGAGNNGGWPGVAMTNVSGNIWSYNVSGSFDKVIFNDGSSQSADLTYGGNNMVAKPDSNSGKFNVSWIPYDGPTQPTQATQATQATQSTTSGGSTTGSSIYLQNTAGWSNPTIYMWNSENDKNAGWPGAAMTSLGDGVYEYVMTKNYANVIFSNNGGSQTSDLVSPGAGNIYDNGSGKWSPYDVGPIKISSFTTSVESPAYTTCDIVLSANAKSTEGAVTYKFTAGSSNGTVVLYEGSANMVSWVPTTAGTYTLAVTVTDTAGNTNSRSMTYEIGDASTLQDVFIKGLSNSLGSATQIKKGAAVSFTMDALGGKVGNNLLFYKFAITEPDNATNVAYYTTSKAYTYTPTKLGEYTIKVSVQNSNNKTLTKTYTYNCVDTIVDNTDPTIPTTPSNPPTEPTDKPTQPTQATYKLGDVNKDTFINISDVTAIQKHLAKIETIDLTYADTDKDSVVSIKDATYIQKYLVGLIDAI